MMRPIAFTFALVCLAQSVASEVSTKEYMAKYGLHKLCDGMIAVSVRPCGVTPECEVVTMSNLKPYPVEVVAPLKSRTRAVFSVVLDPYQGGLWPRQYTLPHPAKKVQCYRR